MMTRYLLAAAAVWACSAAGCCSKNGYILRGDWSFELNRVPFLASNGPTYQSSECGDCTAVDSQCAPACAHGAACDGPRGATRAIPHRCQHHGAPYHEGPVGDEMHPPMPEPPPPAHAAHARFHPVPTRPVFEPDYGPDYGPVLAAPVETNRVSTAGWRSKAGG